jgi:hypothetical protein
MSKRKKHRNKQTSRFPSNTELEMRWVDAWNDLYEIVGGHDGVKCQLSDGLIVSVEECKDWLQESAYEGYSLRIERGQVLGRPGVIASRWMAHVRD